MKTDKERFERSVEACALPVFHLLEEYFGSRCLDYEPNCPSCKRWKAWDTLKENPFA
jgi:hypothetical protein